MTLTRILLASTAISLAGLGSSHAAPLAHASSLTPARPAVTQYLTQVQLSVTDAEAKLAEALARKAEAEASGGDVAAAQAEVEAAEAELAAAKAAVEGGAEAQATPSAEPEAAQETATPAEETAEQPAPSEQAPQPEAEASTEASTDTGTTEQPVPETEQPAAESTSGEQAPEPAPESAPEEPVAPQSETGETAPTQESEAPAEPEAAAEPEAVPAPEATEQEPPAEPEATVEPEPAPAPEATEQQAPAEPEATTEPEAAPAPEATEQEPTAEPEPTGEAEATASEEAPFEPETEQPPVTENPDENTENPTDEAAEATPAAKDGEVLTLPVEDGAPVLDSAKEEQPAADEEGAEQTAAPAASEPAAPPPTSDAEAQASTAESEPAPKALAESGERTTERPEPESQTNVTIVNQYDNRTIIEVDNRIVVEHDDRERLREGSDEVYYERLRGGRVREVIVRPNGVQLVTVTNRWGDVIQRSRVMPDGREYVLFYAKANSDGSREAFVDPGRRLPPLRLSIPIGDYILDATEAEPSAFLEFLMEPPVEQVERLYSVEEVRRSARIRDKVRRIDMDSLTFEFGKATIAEDQVQRLSDVAAAIDRILERNPAETFLIEGHTDAVGRDEANLLLSDRRAETIAVALSDVFGIPPENLVTQGYGERYLKVRTEAPERLNRRVTIRRITPLVTPVASR